MPPPAGFYIDGRPIFVSAQLPMRGTETAPTRLSPFVDVSDEFRRRMDEFLADLFGDEPRPGQPCLVHAIYGMGMVFVSEAVAEKIRKGIPDARKVP